LGVVREIIALSALVGSSSGTLDEVLASGNFPGILLLSGSGVIGMIFIVRWMIHFQRDFTNFYIEENQKLRSRVDDLEHEVQERDDKITDLKTEVGRLRRTTEDHEATIARLNRIIERRKLEE
jgi:phage shock protein A